MVIERTNFFERMYVRSQDLQRLDRYQTDMRRRHNVAHHIWGIVTGLSVVHQQNPDTGFYDVIITKGLAIDGHGREIYLLDDTKLDPAEFIRRQRVSRSYPIYIAYHEELGERPRGGFAACDEPDQFYRIRETARVLYDGRPAGWTNDYSPYGPGVPEPEPDEVDKAFASSPLRQPPAPTDLWPVYLGVAVWDSTTGQFGPPPPTQLNRRHVGVVASEIRSPSRQISVRDDVALQKTLTVKGTGTIEGDLTVKGTGTIDRDLTVKGTGTVDRDLTVKGTGTVDDDLTVHSALIVDGFVGIGTTGPASRLDIATGGVFIRHPFADGPSGKALEIGSQGAATASAPNGRIGFPGYGVRHGQIRWIPDAGTAGRFEFIDSTAASPSGDYGAGVTFVSLRAGQVNGRNMVADGAKLDGISQGAVNVMVLTGELNHDDTIPLPSGYTESQCKWLVSPQIFAPPAFDINEFGVSAQFRVECRTVGLTRKVFVKWWQRGHSSTPGFLDYSGTVNYVIIGIK